MLDYLRFAFLKTPNCRNNALPTRAPQRFILIDVRQQVLDFGQHELIRPPLIVNFLACEQPREWRAIVVVRTRLIRALYRDTYTNTVVARVFREIAGFGGGDQEISISERAFASQDSPARQSAVSIEMIVSD